jgi:hypothetical protein
VDRNGIVLLPRHVRAIQEFLPPTDIKQIQQFLPPISAICHPHSQTADRSPPRGNPKRLVWSAYAADSFLAAKAARVAAVPLTHPAPGVSLALAVDSSETDVGAALQPVLPTETRQLEQTPPPLDFAAVAAAQQSCLDVASMCSLPSLRPVERLICGAQLLGDIYTAVFRPFLPTQFRQAAIKILHNVHHPGVRTTCRLITAAFCWPHMKKDIVAAMGQGLHGLPEREGTISCAASTREDTRHPPPVRSSAP